jgi:hypothetical protein
MYLDSFQSSLLAILGAKNRTNLKGGRLSTGISAYGIGDAFNDTGCVLRQFAGRHCVSNRRAFEIHRPGSCRPQ